MWSKDLKMIVKKSSDLYFKTEYYYFDMCKRLHRERIEV